MIDARDPEISIVIPAYNEQRRLPAFLRDVVTFTSNSSKRYEIIVVDDGSRDRTQAEAGKFSEKHDGVRIVRLDQNRGKGYAVKSGLFKARAPVRVFLDADGSVHPPRYGCRGHGEAQIGVRHLTMHPDPFAGLHLPKGIVADKKAVQTAQKDKQENNL